MVSQHSGRLRTGMTLAHGATTSAQYARGSSMENKTFDSMTPFNKLLSIWARWVSLKDSSEPTGDANLQDTKDFMKAGEAVDAMINELPRHQWWAIRKACGISTVWLFQNLSILDTMEQAEKILTPKMKNNIATRRFFN